MLRRDRLRPIVAGMSDADELARRFLGLWADYLAALMSDPAAAELLLRWLSARPDGTAHAGTADDGAAPSAARPASGAGAVAGASGERGDVVAELARRVDELERRLAAIERPRSRPAARASRGDRAPRD